jgi:transketolase
LTNINPDRNTLNNVREKAREMRIRMVRMVECARSGHLAPAMGCADIVASLFFNIMNFTPENVKDGDRDRFVLSGGHKALALYAALSLKGFFQEEVLYSYCKFNSTLGGHPDASKVPGVEISTGSLGHGIPIGAGIALSGKLKNKDFKVYVLMGDGELLEGSNWEAAFFASHYKLDNLIVIIDRNGLCADGTVKEVMDVEPLKEKWEAFGWTVKEVDGHNIKELMDTFKSIPSVQGKPTIVIANTVKGKGASFMENKYEWHNMVPSNEQFECAYKELQKTK